MRTKVCRDIDPKVLYVRRHRPDNYILSNNIYIYYYIHILVTCYVRFHETSDITYISITLNCITKVS